MKARFGGNMCGFSCLLCSEATSRIRPCLFPLQKEETVAVLSDIPINVEVQVFRFPSKALKLERAHASNYHCLVLFPEKV
jgi:hypothetical protein